MEEIGVDFSVDSSLSDKKVTLFVVDPSQSFVNATLPKEYKGRMERYSVEYDAIPSRMLAETRNAYVWAEEQDIREDVREDATDNREEVNFRSFIKTETST